jgi:hypothetical protein
MSNLTLTLQSLEAAPQVMQVASFFAALALIAIASNAAAMARAAARARAQKPASRGRR